MKNLLPLLFLFMLLSCSKQEAGEKSTEVKPTSETKAPDFRSFIGNDYFIDDQHSYIGFKIKYFGFSPVRGRFNTFDGTAFYDENDLRLFSASVFIDAQSINTGNETRDNDLTTENTWFDTPQFPYIIFKSTAVKSDSLGGFDLSGTLTIKGVTKKITFHFEKPTALSKDWAGNTQVDFSGKAIINRQDFGVFGGDFWSSVMENGLTQLSDEVEIELEIHCRKADYQARYEDLDSSDVRKIVLDKMKNESFHRGLELVDQLFKEGSLSSGKLATIGYTLNTWKMYEQALIVFNKRLTFYPNSHSTFSQLGVTNLLLGNDEKAAEAFKAMLQIDSTSSRAAEYLRLLDSLN